MRESLGIATIHSKQSNGTETNMPFLWQSCLMKICMVGQWMRLWRKLGWRIIVPFVVSFVDKLWIGERCYSRYAISYDTSKFVTDTYLPCIIYLYRCYISIRLNVCLLTRWIGGSHCYGSQCRRYCRDSVNELYVWTFVSTPTDCTHVVLRGDIARLQRCTDITNYSDYSVIKRSKPFKYTYEKEIVMYAYFKKLDYFSTECIYSPNAYRGHARTFLKDLESIRPTAILGILPIELE
jgi:hypothetical protein